jgi:hypothetical protein
MLEILLLLTATLAWGAQVAIPRQLATPGPPRAGNAALALPLLLLAGAAAGYASYAGRPDAAVGAGLVPLWSGLAGRLLLLLLAPWLAVSCLAAAGRQRLGVAGWWIVLSFGAGGLLVASWLFERLEVGAGPPPSLIPFVALVACRMAIAVAAGELVAPRLSAGWPLLAAAALAGSFLLHLLPETRGVGQALLHNGQAVTAGSGALLFAAASLSRLTPRLRRVALLGALLLAAIFLTRAGEISQLLGEDPTVPPMPPLPTF